MWCSRRWWFRIFFWFYDFKKRTSYMLLRSESVFGWELSVARPHIGRWPWASTPFGWQPKFGWPLLQCTRVVHFCSPSLANHGWPISAPKFGQATIWQGGRAATKRARSTLISISNTFPNLQILCLLANINEGWFRWWKYMTKHEKDLEGICSSCPFLNKVYTSVQCQIGMMGVLCWFSN